MRDVKSVYRLIARRLAGLFEKGTKMDLPIVATSALRSVAQSAVREPADHVKSFLHFSGMRDHAISPLFGVLSEQRPG